MRERSWSENLPWNQISAWTDVSTTHVRACYNSKALDNIIATDQLISLNPCNLYKAYRLDLLSVDGRKRVSCTIIIYNFPMFVSSLYSSFISRFFMSVSNVHSVPFRLDTA